MKKQWWEESEKKRRRKKIKEEKESEERRCRCTRVGEEKRREEERRSEKRKSQKKEDAGAWKGRKVAKHCVFPMFCGSGGSKSRLAKVAGAEPSGQMRNQKLHAVVARSTFGSQNVQSTPCWAHCWKLKWWKSARRCGANMSRSNCEKTPRSDHFWTLNRTTLHYNKTPQLQLQLQQHLQQHLQLELQLQLQLHYN